jgi:MFS family permease
MDNPTAYGLLRLTKFSKGEIDWRFDQIRQAGDTKGHSNWKPQHLMHVESNHSSHEEPTMHPSDLEAYLFQRYLRMEDQWNAKHNDNFANLYDNFDTEADDIEQIQFQFKLAMEVHKRQQDRITAMRECARRDAESIFQLLLPHVPSSSSTTTSPDTTITLTKHQFYTSIQQLATQIHYPTILPLASSMLLVGSSVGVISPIMPFLAAKLDLTSSHYGIVVSSFALSKMLGNVPSAILVERHGRKPYLVHSLWLVGLGVAGLGLSNNWVELSLCRMTIGLGVAALTTASTLMVADVSTPLSRASTFSPVMSAFAAGTALGPAMGGILCDGFGIRDTFLMVAASYGVVGVWNRVSLRETGKRGFWMEGGGETLPWHDEKESAMAAKVKDSDETKMSTTISLALQDTIDQWSSLLRDRSVRPIVIMNGFYLSAISGTQMTLLPLLLTNGGTNTAATGMALTATTMGYIYMWMSAVQVLGNPAAGRFADKAGKHTAILAGGVLTSTAMATVPVICAYGLMAGDFVALNPNDVNWPLLAAVLGIWSLGGTLLATSHVSNDSQTALALHMHLRKTDVVPITNQVAAISDAVSDSRRSQAIALLRTAGDIGFLLGALSAGLAADLMGDVGFAMQAGSAVLMGATGWFGLQTLALNQLDKKQVK